MSNSFMCRVRKTYWEEVDQAMSEQMGHARALMGLNFLSDRDVESYDRPQTMSLIASFVGPDATHFDTFTVAVFERLKEKREEKREAGTIGWIYSSFTLNGSTYNVRQIFTNYGPVESRQQHCMFDHSTKKAKLVLTEPLSADLTTNYTRLRSMVNTLVNFVLVAEECPGCNVLCKEDMCSKCCRTLNTVPCASCGIYNGVLNNGLHKHCKRVAKRRRLN